MTAFNIPSTIEAENAELLYGAATNSNHTGYSGTGFVDSYNTTAGPRTLFRVNTNTAGDYDFKLFYANALSNSSLSVYVNSVKIKQTQLPLLATWDTWSSKTETVTLNKGINTVEYVYDATDGGNVNLDKVVVTNSTVTGFEANDLFYSVNVYPNPFTTIIHISKKQVWKLYNNIGQLVAEGNSEVVDGALLESGVYLLKLAEGSLHKVIK